MWCDQLQNTLYYVVSTEGIYHDSHEGLRAILREVEKLSTSLKENKATIEQLEAEKKRWTHANSLLTTQNIHMREVIWHFLHYPC